MLRVLDVRAQDLEAVDLAGERRGDGRLRGSPRSAISRGRAGGVARTSGCSPARRSSCGTGRARGCGCGRGLSVSSVAPVRASSWWWIALEVLADDVQARARQQVVDVGDAAGDRVLDRDHAPGRRGRRAPRRTRPRRSAGQRLQLRPGRCGRPGRSWRRARPGRRCVRLGSGRSLAGSAHRPLASSDRARSRSAGVSTPIGTASTTAASMGMPVLQRPQLLQLLALLQRRGGSATKRVQRLAPVGVDADVVPDAAPRRRAGGAGEIERPAGACAASSETTALTTLGLARSARSASARPGWRCRRPVGEQGKHGADARRDRRGRSPCRLTTTSCAPSGIDARQRREDAVGAGRVVGVGQHGACRRPPPRRRRSRFRRRRPPPGRSPRPSPAARRARSWARRRCRPAACRAGGWRPCARG